MSTTKKCGQCGRSVNPSHDYLFIFIMDMTEVNRDKNARASPLCAECVDRSVDGLSKKRQCTQCAYAKVDPNPKIPIPTVYCKKIDVRMFPTHVAMVTIKGMEGPTPAPFLSSPSSFLSAEKCIHFTNRDEYVEKAIRGEVETKKETHFVSCKYCNCRYDANQYRRCPQCGALTN